MDPKTIRKYRRRSNLYIDFHRLPNGNLLITANQNARKDLAEIKRNRCREDGIKLADFGGFTLQDMVEIMHEPIVAMGWDMADDTVSCWGGPVIAQWGPPRIMTEREYQYYKAECMGREQAMYWLKFEHGCYRPEGSDQGLPVVCDQVLTFQYEPYVVRCYLSELQTKGYVIWYCGWDASKDRGPEECQYQMSLPFDDLTTLTLADDDVTFHGFVPLESQVEETVRGWELVYK